MIVTVVLICVLRNPKKYFKSGPALGNKMRLQNTEREKNGLI